LELLAVAIRIATRRSPQRANFCFVVAGTLYHFDGLAALFVNECLDYLRREAGG
jgi:hypothetical protein